MRNEINALPKEFIERLRRIFPAHKFDAAANLFSEPKPTTFRVNILKTSTNAVREKLEGQEFGLQPVGWYPDAFILKRGRLRELQETEIYKNGEIYVQSLVSMLPPLVLDPQPGETLLDLTAAPGSKTTQIACLMKNQGRIVANDNNKIRFFKLKANIESQGAGIVELSLQYGESFGRKFPNTFDRVLLDAPCSAEGRFDLREPASYKFWKPAKIKEMVRKQKKLFYSAVETLKPAGTLVYSTCTFAPEENEGIVSWGLEKFPNILEIQPIKLPFPNQTPGLGTWNGEKFHPSVRNTLRILPTSEMEGFFLASFRRSATILGGEEKSRDFSLRSK